MMRAWILFAALVVVVTLTAHFSHDYAVRKCDAEKWKSQVDTLRAERDQWKVAAESASKARDEIEAKTIERDKAGVEFAKSLSPQAACVDPEAARRLRGLQ